jgi:hypothetical protein
MYNHLPDADRVFAGTHPSLAGVTSVDETDYETQPIIATYDNFDSLFQF